MKVLIRQFLGQAHSWANVGQNLATSLISKNHDVHLFPTDGLEHLPHHLKSHVIGFSKLNVPKLASGKLPDKNYDLQFSYTFFKNFPLYLSSGNKNRFGMWVFEWSGKNVLPTGSAKYYKYCDTLLVPSNFGKQIFIDSGIPDNVIKVLPHGINKEKYQQQTQIKLPTNKKCKILSVIRQNHLRKNILGLLEVYGKAFTNKDDVCLILKAKEKPVTQQFEISLIDCLRQFKQKYPHHGEIKVLSEYIDDMSVLYRSVDINYSLSFAEGFYFPGLEALASGKINVAPNHGGHLDFLNAKNALLVNGSEVRADIKSMYWQSKDNATWFQSSIDDAVDKLKYAVANYENLNKEIELLQSGILDLYDWNNITNQLLEMTI